MNEDQKSKIAAKPGVNTQIIEITYYLELFKTSQKETLAAEKKLAIKHEKELQAAKLASVRSVANMITLSTIL